MSDEYDEVRYSSFWPLAIILAGLILWIGYQVFAANSQRNVYHQEYANAIPAITEAQKVKAKYVDLINDLLQTSGKDPYAAQIVKEATQAGLLRQTENTNAAPHTGPAQ